MANVILVYVIIMLWRSRNVIDYGRKKSIMWLECGCIQCVCKSSDVGYMAVGKFSWKDGRRREGVIPGKGWT